MESVDAASAEVLGDLLLSLNREEGITLEDYVTWQKSVLLDMAYLQQDAFDEVGICHGARAIGAETSLISHFGMGCL